MSDAPSEADERELTARALAGDEEALGRLLGLHQAWAYNLAYRVLAHEADARDAVQDAFLQTVRSLRGEGTPPRSADSFKPWLRRVVTNAAVTQIRRRGRPADSVEGVADALPGPASGEPGHTVEQDETRGQVLQVLLGLPETQRVALALREYLNASYDEISEVLGLPRTAIGTLLFRGRAAFRTSYTRVAASSPPADCPDLVPLFASIVDGEHRPANWQALEEHLRTCEACGGELDTQRRARRMYALLPLLALPVGWEPVKAALASLAAGGAGAGAAQAVGAAGAGASSTLAASGVGAPATASTVSATGTPVAASAGIASSSGLAGLVAGASGVKLTLAALATAAVVGVGAVAVPLVGQAPGPAASPSPMLAVAASPSPGPGASPGIAASPVGTTATATASSGVSAAPGTVLVAASPSPWASPTPAAAVGGSQPTSTQTPTATPTTPTVVGSTSAVPVSASVVPVGSPTPLLPLASPPPTP